MSRWRSCKQCLSEYTLFLFNLVDMVCGIILIIYSSHLGINHYAPEWLYEPILVLGSFIVVAVLINWCGTTHHGCECCLTLSSWLLVVLALGELVLATLILAKGPEINQFLHQHQEELKLTDEELKLLESHKFVPVYIFAGLFVMESVRFLCVGGLISMRQQNREAYMQLSASHEFDEQVQNAQQDEKISTKYTALKDKYRNKYQQH